MRPTHSLARLQVLLALADQLPRYEFEQLNILAVDDPALFSEEVLAAHRVGRIRLPRHLARALQIDSERPLTPA